MADYLEIQSEELRDASRDIHRYNGDLQEQLKDIGLKLRSLQSDWQSDSSNAIVQKYNNLQGKLDQYRDIVHEYVEFLDKAADQYEKMEATLERNVDTVEFK